MTLFEKAQQAYKESGVFGLDGMKWSVVSRFVFENQNDLFHYANCMTDEIRFGWWANEPVVPAEILYTKFMPQGSGQQKTAKLTQFLGDPISA